MARPIVSVVVSLWPRDVGRGRQTLIRRARVMHARCRAVSTAVVALGGAVTCMHLRDGAWLTYVCTPKFAATAVLIKPPFFCGEISGK